MAAEYPPRDRLSLRAYIRARLRSRGLLEFADDDDEARISADLVYMNCARSWYEDALSKANLELEAVLATSTDVPMQSIENTVRDNDEFWSSTGATSTAAGEALLYRLRQPLSRVAYISLAVYRAFYQHGDPLYPPRKVSFLAGPSPNQLYPASPIYPVRLTEEVQVFAVSPTAAVSHYLMIRLHGRLQRQWEDLQFYIAIRHVAAVGTPVNLSYGLQVARLVRTNGLAWPCTRGLVAAGATTGQGEGCRGAAYGTCSGGLAAAAAPQRPPLVRRLGSRESPQELGLLEDVYEAGPMLSKESPGACFSVAPRRRGVATLATKEVVPEHPGKVVADGKSEAGQEAEAKAEEEEEEEENEKGGALPTHRPKRALRCHHRAVLPSGPTDWELRLAVQHAALQRTLPHLVHVPWRERLMGGQNRYLPRHNHQRQQQQQRRQARWGRAAVQHAATTAGSDAATAAPSGLLGILGGRVAWHGRDTVMSNARPQERGAHLPLHRAIETSDDDDDGIVVGCGGNISGAVLGRGNSGGGPGTVGRAEGPEGGQMSVLQRLREWVVAAARGTAADVRRAGCDSDTDINMDTQDQDAGGQGEVANRTSRRSDSWPGIGRVAGSGSSGSGGCAALPTGIAASGSLRTSGSCSQGRRGNTEEDEGEVEEQGGSGVTLGLLREDLTPRGGDAAAAATAPSPLGSAAPQLFFADASSGASSAAAERVARLQALALSYLHSWSPALTLNMPLDWHELLTLSQQQQQQQQDEEAVLRRRVQDAAATVGAAAAAAASTSSALQSGENIVRHTRPLQLLPPPKFRRRGDAGLGATPAAGRFIAAGRGGGGGVPEAQRQRQRRHLRAVHRAMQPALYCPYRNSALFIALEAWAGVGAGGGGAGSSSSVVPQATATAAALGGRDDSSSCNAGCWLVSHYDHEHL